jgi:hypothetical protein
VFGVRAGAALDAPPSPSTVETSAGVVAITARTSRLEKVEVSKRKENDKDKISNLPGGYRGEAPGDP